MSKSDATHAAKPPRRPGAETPPRTILTRVMLGLGLWGLILGIGATLFGVGENGGIGMGFRPLRGLVVWTCVGGFLAFWALLLRTKKGEPK